MKLGGGLPMVYRKVACESCVEWTRQPWRTSSSPPESIFRFHRHGGGQICPQKLVWNSHI